MISKNLIIDIMEEIAPTSLAEDWDNVGMVVDINENINGALIVVDVTKSSIIEAKEKGANLIISHHPLMFNAIKSICSDDVVYYAIKNDISVYCAHTNMDLAKNGLNQKLAQLIGLCDIKLLSNKEEEYAFGRVGLLESETKLKDLAVRVKNVLDIEAVRVMGDKEKIISKVAVCSGNGSEFISEAINIGAQVIITSEVKHNIYVDNIESGICIIDAGHYDTEKHFVNMIRKSLQESLSDIQYNLQVFISEKENRPYWTI